MNLPSLDLDLSLDERILMTSTEAPFYRPVGDEVEVFRAAAQRGLPVLLKGPTGCGKTRFVEAMAHDVGRDVYTVALGELIDALLPRP